MEVGQVVQMAAEENGAISRAHEKISSLKGARGEEARIDSFFFLSKKAGEREG